MTNAPGPQTITPERQVAAQHVGAVFNSLHEYIRNLEHADDAGNKLLTKHLEFAHQRIDEAAMWAIKHVLTHGAPAAKPAPAASANDTPAPIGVVDPLSDPPISGQPSFEGQAPLPTDNAAGAEPV